MDLLKHGQIQQMQTQVSNMKTFKRFNAKSSKKDKLPMTIIEAYRKWLVEGEVVSIGPALARRKLTNAMDKAHRTFYDVDNEDENANYNAVQDLQREYDGASPEGREHMINHMKGKGKKEFEWQITEHGRKNHPLTKAMHQE